MSQFPSPYSQPQYPIDNRHPAASPDLLAPARRASIMMIVLGALALLLGACSAFSAYGIPRETLQKFLDDPQISNHGQLLPPGVSLDQAMHEVAITSVVILIGAFIMIPLGIFVRHGKKTTTVFAVIFCALAIVCVGLNELPPIVQALGGNPMAALSACIGLAPLVMFGLTISWLMKVLRTLPQIEAARQQWESQYASSRQQQQAYHQAVYGTNQTATPQQYDGQSSPGGSPAVQPLIGYGAMPKPSASPPREPPLPPDQQNLPQ